MGSEAILLHSANARRAAPTGRGTYKPIWRLPAVDMYSGIKMA
jgi:hypothetical protein